MDYSSTNIDILDISITKNSTKLPTDIFPKENDSYQYQHTTPCHLTNCKKYILYGQAICKFALKESIEKKS